MGQIPLPRFRCDFNAKKLREPSPGVRARAGDFQSLMRKNRNARLILLEVNGRLHMKNFPRLILGRHPGRLNHLDILPRAPVRDGRLIGVQLNHRVVDPLPGERRQDMLHRVNFGVPFGQRRRPVGRADVIHPRLDFRLSLQVHPPESNPRIRRPRMNRHIDSVSAMETDPRETGRGPQSLLVQHGQNLRPPPPRWQDYNATPPRSYPKPRRRATSAACVRFCACSLPRMFETWFFTVPSARCNLPAISLLGIPWASITNTSRSRSERGSINPPDACSAARSVREAISGWMNTSPSCTRRMVSISFSAGKSFSR